MSSETTKAKPRLITPISNQDHKQGPPNAPVVLVEYGDYECPHCRLVFHNVKALQERLGDKMCYVYRHLPITSAHPHAQMAAEAAEAAGAQGKFWEMHEMLYGQESLDRTHIFESAHALDLDMELFQDDLDNHRFAERVQSDFNGGIRSGVNGTPTFFLNGERYDGAWDLESLLELVEKPLGTRVRLLSQEFSRLAASGGIVLLACTIVALLWRNSALGEGYVHFWETTVSFNFGDTSLSEGLLEWINDGLMVIFFFVVGLEIKREVTTGELASPRKAALPVAGALGGMLIPAAIYLIFNAGGPAESGWGIPMATDIAFTLGILTVLGSRVPLSLKIFFTALAIADDLGAILVIAIFYTAEIVWVSLLVAAVILVILVAINRARIYSPLPYGVLGFGLWLAFLESGVHPTFAGVLLAMTIPTRSPPYLRGLLAQVVTLLESFELPVAWREHPDSRRQAAVSTIEQVAERMQSPAQRMEERLSPWATYLILPIFALANAGVAVSADSIGNLFSMPSVGIVLGLVIGKPVGITALSWMSVRLGLASLPGGVDWRQFFSVSCLAGIGFTMSLFISSAAFDDPALVEGVKLAILVASVLAALLGTGLLLTSSPNAEETTQMQPSVATAA